MVPLRNRYQKKVFKYGTPNPGQYTQAPNLTVAEETYYVPEPVLTWLGEHLLRNLNLLDVTLCEGSIT